MIAVFGCDWSKCGLCTCEERLWCGVMEAVEELSRRVGGGGASMMSAKIGGCFSRVGLGGRKAKPNCYPRITFWSRKRKLEIRILLWCVISVFNSLNVTTPL